MRQTLSRLAALFVLLAVSAAARAQSPVVTAWIGTQTRTSHVGYFVLDFNDPDPNPQVYTFGYYYEGSPTGSDFILALETALTGPNGFKETGAANNFLTLLGYNGRAKFNDFAGNNSGDPNGFWSLWLGNTSPQNSTNLAWTNAQFGAADVVLSDTPLFKTNSFTGTNELYGSQWQGWRWVPDFSTSNGVAPRVSFTSAAAPEPATLALVGCGILAVTGIRRRK